MNFFYSERRNCKKVWMLWSWYFSMKECCRNGRTQSFVASKQILHGVVPRMRSLETPPWEALSARDSWRNGWVGVSASADAADEASVISQSWYTKRNSAKMGNCCSTFRAVFKPNDGSPGMPLSPVRGGSCRKPDCLPKPPPAGTTVTPPAEGE